MSRWWPGRLAHASLAGFGFDMLGRRFDRSRRRFAVKRVGLVALLGAAAFLLIGGRFPEARPASVLETLRGEPEILVRLSAPRGATVAVRGPYRVHAGAPRAARGDVMAEGGTLAASAIAFDDGDGWRVGPYVLDEPWVELVPARDGDLEVGGVRYRGSLYVGRHDDTTVLVNRLGIEAYLAGVIGAEMPIEWSDEALLAQAICARTYALHELGIPARTVPYDVRDTVASQVYSGIEGREDHAARAAELVGRCRGLVMYWNDRPFKAFFHSTCGGRTTSAARVFVDFAITPLSGRPCAYCGESKLFRWKREFPRAEVERRVAKTLGKTAGKITSIPVTYADGRATKVRVIGDKRTIDLSGEDFRRALGPGKDNLPSTAFDVQVAGDKVTFTGAGWGHGVGLCQFGAQGMARAGKHAREILEHYYPGAQIVRLWE